MKTKIETIAKAYGEHWDGLEKELKIIALKNDGWLKQFDYRFNLPCESKIINGYICNRPKSLFGIENNNGWIKIESEADLPKEKTKVWFIVFGEEKIGTFNNILKEFKSQNESYTPSVATHYQPIIKPQPPIY